jgi:2-polyprenyl-3-methyl-5-hydroxy-6-metoxy-1,4-benzoquinol methylase
MESKELNPIQLVQEEQYSFPYHYIPDCSNDSFSQVKHWSWGHHYLGGIEVVMNLCDEKQWGSLLDIGCGDGRFISELHKKKSNKVLTGYDYSERAINMAKALNPQIDYKQINILDDDQNHDNLRQYDVVTLIEVVEHINPIDLPKFIEKAMRYIKPGGRLILTVPHLNKVISNKHFQHFNSVTLEKLLGGHFADLKMSFIDKNSRILQLFLNLLGGKGNKYIITEPKLNNLFYKFYRNKYLYCKNENECGRIAVVAANES